MRYQQHKQRPGINRTGRRERTEGGARFSFPTSVLPALAVGTPERAARRHTCAFLALTINKRDHETFVNTAYLNRYSDSDFSSPPHQPRHSGLCEIYDMGG
jgi:hypothetical protein